LAGLGRKGAKLSTELGRVFAEIGKKYIDSSIDAQFATTYFPRKEGKGGDNEEF
jgi:hypothetical protein